MSVTTSTSNLRRWTPQFPFGSATTRIRETPTNSLVEAHGGAGLVATGCISDKDPYPFIVASDRVGGVFSPTSRRSSRNFFVYNTFLGGVVLWSKHDGVRRRMDLDVGVTSRLSRSAAPELPMAMEGQPSTFGVLYPF